MAVLFWFPVKITCPMDTITVLAYNEQVTFYKVLEQHIHV